MNDWMYLWIAIAGEVIATSTLKASEGFTKLIPSLVVVVGYIIAFYFLSLTLKTIPVGIANAVWSGMGMILIPLCAWAAFGQKIDAPAAIGMVLILAGVLILNLFSKVTVH